MKKFNTLDTARMPDGESISLHEHDGAYSVRVDGAELMSTRRHASEDRLAELACEGWKERPQVRVLIGGLGLGFTLKAALAALGADAAVTVAEISPALIGWNQNPLYPLAADALADPRVTLLTEDVAEVIRRSPAAFDGIMLDVDNGAAAFSAQGNARLYDLDGVREAAAALKPGGRAAYWSAAPNPAFEKLMARAGFAVEAQRCRAHPNSGAWHTILLGTKLHPAEDRKAGGNAQAQRDARKGRTL
jgi:spermidine synthase